MTCISETTDKRNASKKKEERGKRRIWRKNLKKEKKLFKPQGTRISIVNGLNSIYSFAARWYSIGIQ